MYLFPNSTTNYSPYPNKTLITTRKSTLTTSYFVCHSTSSNSWRFRTLPKPKASSVGSNAYSRSDATVTRAQLPSTSQLLLPCAATLCRREISLSCFKICGDVHAQLSVFVVEYVLAHIGHNIRYGERCCVVSCPSRNS